MVDVSEKEVNLEGLEVWDVDLVLLRFLCKPYVSDSHVHREQSTRH